MQDNNVIPSLLEQHFIAFVNNHGVLNNEHESVVDRLKATVDVIGIKDTPVITQPCEDWATKELGREVDDQWLAYFDLIRMRTQFFSYLFENRVGMLHQTTYELAISNYYTLLYLDKWHEKFDEKYEREYWLQ